MITLALDTSHIFLTVALIEDNTLKDSIQKKCWKKQSEEVFPCVMDLLERNQLKPNDIEAMVVSEGPGSYTGVRIAMTIAKVFCALKEVPLYTVGTLQLFAGLDDCRVVLDARGGRCYTAVLNHGTYTEKPHVAMVSEIHDTNIKGDRTLLGLSEEYDDLAKNFVLLKEQWVKSDNVNLVKPEYLKSSESYLVK